MRSLAGHVKAYPSDAGGSMGNYVRCVKGETYGSNNFILNEDGTITDSATGLMWTQRDSGVPLDWPNALSSAERSTFANYSDWWLPSVKELQNIVDYSGILPAIDPLFSSTPISNEAGNADYAYYWSSTSARLHKYGHYYYAC